MLWRQYRFPITISHKIPTPNPTPYPQAALDACTTYPTSLSQLAAGAAIGPTFSASLDPILIRRVRERITLACKSSSYINEGPPYFTHHRQIGSGDLSLPPNRFTESLRLLHDSSWPQLPIAFLANRGLYPAQARDSVPATTLSIHKYPIQHSGFWKGAYTQRVPRSPREDASQSSTADCTP